MAKFEIEYSKRDTVIIEADTQEEAEEEVYSFMENDWYNDDYYSRYGMEAKRDKEGSRCLVNEIVSVKELPDTALSILLDKIRNQKPAHKKPLGEKG